MPAVQPLPPSSCGHSTELWWVGHCWGWLRLTPHTVHQLHFLLSLLPRELYLFLICISLLNYKRLQKFLETSPFWHHVYFIFEKTYRGPSTFHSDCTSIDWRHGVFWASLLSVSYFACFFLLLGFMIVQKYSFTTLKFLKTRNTSGRRHLVGFLLRLNVFSEHRQIKCDDSLRKIYLFLIYESFFILNSLMWR